MRALLLGILLVIGFIPRATAQLAVGPVSITSSINGIPITVSVTSWVTVTSAGDEITVDARIFADLIDLQKKFSDVVDSFKRGARNCSRGADGQNPVVSFKSGSLWPRSDQLIMFVRGDIDIWSCSVGRPQSAIRWEKTKVSFLTLKLPVRRTWRNVKRNMDGTQPFHGTLSVSLAEKDGANVALRNTEPNIRLDGEPAFATNANLSLAKTDMNEKVSKALRSAIDLTKLKDVLPKELQKLNMTINSARFRDRGGHAIAEINLSGKTSSITTISLLQQVGAGL
ncbi:MAG TPA: hypothetical protein VH558_11715 [Pseudolabrys sp.]|jgi:hypothetical protein